MGKIIKVYYAQVEIACDYYVWQMYTNKNVRKSDSYRCRNVFLCPHFRDCQPQGHRPIYVRGL